MLKARSKTSRPLPLRPRAMSYTNNHQRRLAISVKRNPVVSTFIGSHLRLFSLTALYFVFLLFFFLKTQILPSIIMVDTIHTLTQRYPTIQQFTDPATRSIHTFFKAVQCQRTRQHQCIRS